MTNQEQFSLFKLKKNWSVDKIASFFGVSVPAVRKWETIDGKVPDYVVKIIELENNNEYLLKEIDNLKFDITSIKQSIHNYFTSKTKLEDIIKD